MGGACILGPPGLLFGGVGIAFNRMLTCETLFQFIETYYLMCFWVGLMSVVCFIASLFGVFWVNMGQGPMEQSDGIIPWGE